MAGRAILALTIPGNSATLATPFKIRGVNYSISSACSTSSHCIGNAAEMIQIGNQKIVFAGAMYYHRGLDVLLEAIPKIIRKIPDAKFILLGNGNELEKLKEIVLEKNLENSVEFKGWIEREKIPENISDASIGIGPLRLTDVTSRALPIKVLEYMAVSLPIIAQKGTLPDDVLVNEKNGYFVDGAEDLAEKISSLLNEPDKINQMGNQSRLMVQNFSWDHIIKNVLEAARKN